MGLLLAVLVAGLLGLVGATQAQAHPTQAQVAAAPAAAKAAFPPVKLAELPAKAADVVAKIKKGGPFDYPKNDGKTFSNREGLLPKADKGYYREHTVVVKGSEDVSKCQFQNRGTCRIVTGGKNAKTPEHWYWTNDHYKSYKEITDAGK